MFETIMTVIRSADFQLEKVLDRIRFYHAKGQLSTDEMEQLMLSARARAVETMGVDAKTEILALWSAVHELQRKVAELTPVDPDEPDEPPEEEIPEYVQPTGAHDAYNTGDKVRYNGKVYVCKMDNCVWSPDAYPAGWELVE